MARCSASMPQSGGGVHVDVEGRLVELDDVDAVGGKPARFLVEELGKGERHFHPVAVMGVGDGVDDGHRPRQSEFELVAWCGRAQARASRACTRARSRSGPVTVGHIAL